MKKTSLQLKPLALAIAATRRHVRQPGGGLQVRNGKRHHRQFRFDDFLRHADALAVAGQVDHWSTTMAVL
jgi:hypothetical protein